MIDFCLFSVLIVIFYVCKFYSFSNLSLLNFIKNINDTKIINFTEFHSICYPTVFYKDANELS